MLQQILLTLGAGAASAVLFVLPAKGSLAAMLFGIVAPLPLMIVALGFGPLWGGLAVAVGVAVIGAVIDPLLAAVFLASVACPALALAWLARLRPHAGLLVAAIVALVVAIDWLGLAALGWRFGSYDAAIDALAQRFAPIVVRLFGSEQIPGGISAQDFAAYIVEGMPPAMALWGVLAYAGNLWLAGRVSLISGHLKKAWPDVPATLRLPRATLVLFLVALALCFFPAVTRAVASTAAAALATSFALQGLATLHALTRGRPGRFGLLSGLYVLTAALFPWPLILAAGLGLLDLVRPQRPASFTPPRIR